MAALMLALVLRRRRQLHASWFTVVLGLSLGAALAAGSDVAWGQDSPDRVRGVPAYKVPASGPDSRAPATKMARLIAQLGDPDRAQAAAERLGRIGRAAIDPLLDDIADTTDTARKGWAIIALTEIASAQRSAPPCTGDAGRQSVRCTVDRELTTLHSNGRQPALVQTWAAAARVELARSLDELNTLSTLGNRFPAVRRPLGLRAVELAGRLRGDKAAEAMLLAAARNPQMGNELQGRILALGSKPLTRAMVRSGDTNVRRMAASYLGALANRGDKTVARRVVSALRFRPGAKAEPWQGGALFLPALKWSQADGRALVGNLLRWHLWAERNQKRALHN
ncbi:MAG: hypothetical protein AAGC55_34425, partial [Myxococcota bacterium]